MSERGFTLTELVIAAAVMVIAILSMMQSSFSVMNVSQASYQKSVAMQDANTLLENMRDLAATGTFPANVTGTYANNSTVSYSNLPSETATITYASSTANPLDVRVTVSYLENSVRSTSVTVRSYITQRL